MPIDRTFLTDDYSISPVIKGSWQISTGHSAGGSERKQQLSDMQAFVDRGITTFDFGDIYLGVEELVGAYIESLRERFGENAQEAVQLHTKYVPDIDKLASHSFADVERIIDRSRQRLRVDRLDLVQFHWWNYEVPGYVQSMVDLQRLQTQGKIRLLGVTNFDVPRMKAFVDAGVTPSTIQLQYSLLDRRPENGMSDFCREHEIAMLCYGTVAGGFLSEKYLGMPEPTPPFENRSLTKYRLIIEEFGGWELFQELLRTLDLVAKKHHVSISTVASAYVLGKPQIAGVIVGARNADHIQENVAVSTLMLDADDHAAIAEVLDHSPGPHGDVYGLERDDPKHAGIMHKSNNAKGR
jgi:aryl-alcohol dehydrogenase-like predicted oxidoreductase